MRHPTDRIIHTMAFVTPVVENWLEREIAQWVHTYLLNIVVSTTQTLFQIKSQECVGHIQKHFISSPLTYVTNNIQDFVKCCIKSWVHLDLRPDSMLFGGLHPIVSTISIQKSKILASCRRQ